MRLDIFVRRALAGQVADPAPCQLLLEGDWTESVTAPVRRLALDTEVDNRWQWIDDEADRLAARIVSDPPAPCTNIGGLRVDWLCALELRYYLVRLLRVAAYLDGFLEDEGVTGLRLFADSWQDADYAEVIGQLCRLRAIRLETHGVASSATAVGRQLSDGHVERFPRLRSQVARLCRRWDQRHADLVPHRDTLTHANGRARQEAPVVLCGHPSLFDPLCESLVRRGTASVYLLAEQFAFRSFARWRWRGVRLLDCIDGERIGSQAGDLDVGDAFHRRDSGVPSSPLRFGGVDLAAPVADWLKQQTRRFEGRLSKAIGRIGEHYDRIRPGWLLVDEDATPFKRAAVALARERGIATAVVQHGAPYIAFGFAPLVADYLFAWGESSRRQFQRWGMPEESLVVAGSPKHDAWFASAVGGVAKLRVGCTLPTTTPCDQVGTAHPTRSHALPNFHEDSVASIGARMAPSSLMGQGRSGGASPGATPPQPNPPPRGGREFHSVPNSVWERISAKLRFGETKAELGEADVPKQELGNKYGDYNEAEKHLLLFTTVHHAPERPDLAGFHLTARTHAEMVRWVLEAVAVRLGWDLTIKLHPRTPDAGFFEDLVDFLPAVRNRVQLLKTGDVLALARRADCVLSCASSAGIEAMISGRPVIQLMPPGSADLIDPEDWGFAGTARSGDELDRLLSRIDRLDRPDDARLERNFANRHIPAVEQIVEFLSRKSRRRRRRGRESLRLSASMHATSRSA